MEIALLLVSSKLVEFKVHLQFVFIQLFSSHKLPPPTVEFRGHLLALPAYSPHWS